MARNLYQAYKWRRPGFCASLLLLSMLVMPSHTAYSTTPPPVPAAPEFRLHLRNLHTEERLDVVYRVGSEYVPQALESLDHILRDHRSGDVHHFDPRLFDLLTDLTAAVGQPEAEINILSGYRSPESNAYLRQHSSGVAKNSLHMQAEAIDIRVPEVKISQLRKAAISLERGGVGYYPRSNFIHVDVGQVRRW